MFEQAVKAAGYGVLITDTNIAPPGPTILFANDAMSAPTGYTVEEMVGADPRFLQGAETDPVLLARLKEALLAGRSFNGEAVNYRKDGSSYHVDWTINPMHDASGAITAWVSVQRDVTRRRRARQILQESEQRLHVLVAELQHRTRNIMGVVRSMADRTARASADLPDFRSRFGARLDALARVQGLLSRLEEHDRVTFDELLRTELAAIGDGPERVGLRGPDGVRLRSATVQTLAMALHELATNAVKYGALSQPAGRLSVTWSVEPAGEDGSPLLHIDWKESGVTAPPPDPHHVGSGRELIERALPYQLKARTRFAFEPDGVHCTIIMPVSAITTR